jgi:hypothetical protein
MAKRKTLSPGMQKWYDSDAPGLVADALLRDLHMVPENKGPLINIVGDTALGLIPVADLPNQIPDYLPMPPSLARALAEHLVMLLTQARVLTPTAPTVSVPRPVPPPPPVPAPMPVPPAPPTHEPPTIPQAAWPGGRRWQRMQDQRSSNDPSAARPIAPQRPAAPAPQPQPPSPMPPSAPPSWQHVRTDAPQAPMQAPPQPQAPAPQTPPSQIPPVVPSYQKPLTQVPQYRNANLYQKLEEKDR